MNDRDSARFNVIDLQKRQSSSGVKVAALATGSNTAALPTLSNESDQHEADPERHAAELATIAPKKSLRPPVQLEAILIRIPKTAGESVILQNLTDKDIDIERFHANKVEFEGELVGCKEARQRRWIKVPAHDKVLVRFEPRDNNNFSSPVGEFLDAYNQKHSVTESTRFVHLVIRMVGNRAIFSAFESATMTA